MADSVSPRTTSWYWASGSGLVTAIWLSTDCTLETLPQHSVTFSLTAWVGAVPSTVTLPCEPSNCTFTSLTPRFCVPI